MTTMQGIRINQVAAGTRIGDQIVTDTQGVQDAKTGAIYVTAKHYEGIKAAARDDGMVTYQRR